MSENTFCWSSIRDQKLDLVERKNSHPVYMATKPKPRTYYAAMFGKIIYEGSVPYYGVESKNLDTSTDKNTASSSTNDILVDDDETAGFITIK